MKWIEVERKFASHFYKIYDASLWARLFRRQLYQVSPVPLVHDNNAHDMGLTVYRHSSDAKENGKTAHL